jgi:uncharacterized phage protein (TIGR01671 family)
MKAKEIEFRGINKETGKWIYGDLLRNDAGDFAVMQPFGINRYNECSDNEIYPETLCQFTGMVDGGGNKIYENDILREKKTGKVVLIEWNGIEYGYRYAKNPFGYVFPNHTENFEVIGNKWDNPELLK